MKAEYEVNVKIKASYEIDTIEGLKSNSEFAEDLAQMICDEVATAGGVASYEIIKSEVKATPRYCEIWQGCPHDKKVCCCDCEIRECCNVPFYLECFPETCNCLTYEDPS